MHKIGTCIDLRKAKDTVMPFRTGCRQQARGQFLRTQHEQQPICTSIQQKATEVHDRAGMPSGCTRKCSGSTHHVLVVSVNPSLHDGLDEQARNSVRVNLHRQTIITLSRAPMPATAYPHVSKHAHVTECQCKSSGGSNM